MREYDKANINFIDASKRNVIERVCFLVKNNEIVQRIIIFGSAAEGGCDEDSDLDICYDITCDTRDMRVFELSKETSKLCDYNCDIVYYGLLGSSLKNEIDKKGVVVYES